MHSFLYISLAAGLGAVRGTLTLFLKFERWSVYRPGYVQVLQENSGGWRDIVKRIEFSALPRCRAQSRRVILQFNSGQGA